MNWQVLFSVQMVFCRSQQKKQPLTRNCAKGCSVKKQQHFLPEHAVSFLDKRTDLTNVLIQSFSIFITAGTNPFKRCFN